LRHFVFPTRSACDACLRLALGAGSELGALAAARLAAAACARASPPQTALAALLLLCFAAALPGERGIAVRLLSLAPPPQLSPDAPQPLAWLVGLLSMGGLEGSHRVPSCDALCSLLSAFAEDAASRAALRTAACQPLDALLQLTEMTAPSSGAASAEAPSLGRPAAGVRVAIRCAALAAMARLAEADPWLVKAEGFTTAARGALKGTDLWKRSAAALAASIRGCAWAATASHGWDGCTKSFTRARTARDAAPLMDGRAAEESSLVLSLRLLHALLRASPRNAAALLHASGATESLTEVTTTFSGPVDTLRAAETVIARIAWGCPTAATAALEGADVAPLAAMLWLGLPGCAGFSEAHSGSAAQAEAAAAALNLRIRSAERLACLLPTASGDAYIGSMLALKGGLQALHTALCLAEAVPTGIEAATKAAGVSAAPLASLFLACLERSRASVASAARAVSGAASDTVPIGGYWDAMGAPEILRIEAVLLAGPGGAAWRTRGGRVGPPAALAGAAAARLAPTRQSSSEPKSVPTAVPSAPLRPVGSADKGKQLPWDPPPAVPAAAPGAPPVLHAGLIKQGFFGKPPTKRSSTRCSTLSMPSATVFAGNRAIINMHAAEAVPALERTCDETFGEWSAQLTMSVSEGSLILDPAASAGKPPHRAADVDEDGLRVTFDSAGLGVEGEKRRSGRTAWAALDLRDKLSWNQDSTSVTATVKLPAGTRASELAVRVTPTHISLTLAWHGRVLDGPLARRCKAGEAVWSLDSASDGCLLTLFLPKDDPFFWKSLFEGGEEKSHYEVLTELVRADEAAPRHDEVDEETRDLLADLQEHQAMVNEGLVDPINGFDDFRLVIGDGDGAK